MEAFLLENLPILLCFLFGVVLLIVEVFMPGFGLPGISGIILEGAAIVLTYLWHGGLAALGVTVLILAIVAVAISLALRSANRGRLSKSNIILKDAETAENGYSATSAADMQVFVGRKGVTSTPLRPTGLAEFDGVRLNVASQGDFIPKDTSVIVDHVEGASVVVRRLPTPIRLHSHFITARRKEHGSSLGSCQLLWLRQQQPVRAVDRAGHCTGADRGTGFPAFCARGPVDHLAGRRGTREHWFSGRYAPAPHPAQAAGQSRSSRPARPVWT